MPEAMGGYFELELSRGNHPYPDAHGFNSARSAFQAVLLAYSTRRVYLPHFICAVMSEAALAVGVEVLRYDLNDALELLQYPTLQADEQLLYVNYFGLKGDYVEATLALHYRTGLIVDNSQALFSPPVALITTLYSPRKFVGVPDGGWLLNGPVNLPTAPPGSHQNRLDALLGRLADGPEAHYGTFQKNETALGLEGLRSMSTVTRCLLDSIDYAAAKKQRMENMNQVHTALGTINRFKAWPGAAVPALCYPLLLGNAEMASALRSTLVQARIFVPVYWREVIDNAMTPTLEKNLSECLLPLPIDQRYGAKDMQRMNSIILDFMSRQPTEYE